MNLYTAYYSSPVGLLKLQCSDKYFKTVSFCDAEGEIQNDEHKLLQSCAKQLDEYFTGKRKQFNLPSNIAGVRGKSGPPGAINTWWNDRSCICN